MGANGGAMWCSPSCSSVPVSVVLESEQSQGEHHIAPPFSLDWKPATLPAMLRLRLALFVLLLGFIVPSSPQEVQKHGVVFEKWIRDTFFDGYTPQSYTQKWDIPSEANKKYGGIPVNPKATKYRTAVDMGDALRQYDIHEPFWLIVGYWQQNGTEKKFVNIVAARIEPDEYHKLWGDVKRADLEKLDSLIKDTPSPVAARQAAQKLKREAPFNTSVISLNPKIDSKHQRRLQCSLTFAKVFKYLAPKADPSVQPKPML